MNNLKKNHWSDKKKKVFIEKNLVFSYETSD